MNKNEIAGLVERLNKYIADYNDAPSWGGPTMYPVPPSFAQIKTMADALTTLSAENERMREYLKKIDVAVSHAKMGDWSIALTEIRKYVADALGASHD